MSKQSDLLNLTDAISVSGSNVGIGTTSPDAKIKIQNDNSTVPSLVIRDDGTPTTHMVNISSNATGTVLQIDSAGKIQIGSNIPMWSGQYGGALVLKGNNATSDRYAQLAIVDSTGAIVSQGLIVDTTGNVTMPYQPAFQVSPASEQSNIAVGSNVTVVFGTEVFDVGANFASNTFTAPVTGKYQLNLVLYFNYLDTASDYYVTNIVTSNRNYPFAIDPRAFSSDPVYWFVNLCVLADMDASDTATVVVVQASGTAQTDIATGTTFSGYLVA